jgi:hypothetical protein
MQVEIKAFLTSIQDGDEWSAQAQRFTLARGSTVDKALRYKPEDRGFETRSGDLIFFN